MLQNLAGQCEFSSEWNKYAQDTYEKNYAECPDGDISLKELGYAVYFQVLNSMTHANVPQNRDQYFDWSGPQPIMP